MPNYHKLRDLVRKNLSNEVATYKHTEWVYEWCLKIGEEMGANLEILLPAALVHDIGVPIDKEKHYEAGMEKAGEILRQADIPKKDMEYIFHCVESHSCKGGPDPQTLEARILYDATKIDHLGVKGMIQTFLENFQERSLMPQSLWKNSVSQELTFDPQIHQEKLLGAWKEFISNGESDGRAAFPHIIESWRRSRNCNVDPHRFSSDSYLSQHEHKKIIRGNQCLIDIARPFMEIMYESLEGTGYVVGLYDTDGYHLLRMGQKSDFDRLSELGINETLCFAEEMIGTTGFALAKYMGIPVQIIGCEHYACPMHFIVGSYAPIQDLTRNDIISVIGIYGAKTLPSPQTMGMAMAASRAIENSLRLDKAQKTLFIYSRALQTAMDSMADGVILIDTGGRVYEINSSAEKILDLEEKEVRGKHISDIISISDLENRILSILQSRNSDGLEIDLEINNQLYITTIKFVKDECEKIQGVFVLLKNLRNLKKILHNIGGEEAKFTFDTMIGSSKKICEIKEIAKLAASSDSNIIIEGESGTGKEVLAQAIHNFSSRRDEPFVVINCSTIPSELMESALFGHEKGAFTGAVRTHIGKFELADKGTVFLDEIADMPLNMQAKLLRVMEGKTIERVGGKESIKIDIRVIAATNRDILEEINHCRFREDLYFRLRVFRIGLPPLRGRKEDIYELVPYFIKYFNSYFGGKIKSITDNYYRILMDYEWPGNVRELKNAVQYSMAVSDGDVLNESHLCGFFEQIKHGNGTKEIREEFMPTTDLSRVEKMIIERTLGQTKGNKAEASRLLGIGRATLYRKMRSLGIG